MKKIIVIKVFLIFVNPLLTQAEAIIYPVTENRYFATDYVVTADNQTLAVYDMLRPVFHNWAKEPTAPFAVFGLQGEPVTIRVKVPTHIHKVTVRPLRLGIKCNIEDERTISFQVTEPCTLSIEINDDLSRPLLLFANPVKSFTEQLKGKNVLRFEAGKVHDAGAINLEDNQVVYIEAGALVKGSIKAIDKKNISVFGYGILLNEYTQPEKKGPSIFMVNGCENVTVDGPVMVNRYDSWSVNLVRSRNIHINNLKILAETRDGLDVNSSSNMVFNNGFILSGDDCIAIKAARWGKEKSKNAQNKLDAVKAASWGDAKGGEGQSVKNIQILNSTVFNAAGGNALEIGYESCTETISDIVFKNIDIIHLLPNTHPEFPECAMSIHLSDFATVKNILFEDIRVEDNQDDWLVHMDIWKSYATKIDKRGNIHDVQFKNIQLLDTTSKPIGLFGNGEMHTVENILFDGIWVNGKQVKSLRELQYQQNEFVKNITFKTN